MMAEESLDGKRRGASLLEFALVFVVFIALVLAAFDFGFAIFLRATLHHAVREGVRYAITGRMMTGLGHDDSIRQIVKANSLGLLTDQQVNDVKIEYFLPDCGGGVGCGSPTNAASNIIVVAVEGYEFQPLGPVLRAANPFTINVTAVDKMEPFPGIPPLRVLPPPP